MKIAYAVCSLGLGHASRSVPIIKKLIEEGHEITILAHGRAKIFLEKIFDNFDNIDIIDLPDYPIEYSKSRAFFFPKIVLSIPSIITSFADEHQIFFHIHQKKNFNLIISDNRYGIYNRNVPSFIITHQLRIMNPYRIRILESATMIYNSFISRYFKKLIVPDFEYDSLSGDLSHNLKYIDISKISYIGPLSSYKKKEFDKDLDILISISGPEPQRTIFERLILKNLEKIKNKKYKIILGRPDLKNVNENILNFASSDEMEILFNRAKIIVSRSGYSTIMDLYHTGGKPFFVPTPAQPEQEYLAIYLNKKGISGYKNQEDFDFDDLLNYNYRGFEGGYDTSISVKKFIEEVLTNG
ncbi:MAG: glycosyltransferase family protein [Thermoplasmata archaeon]